MNKYYNLDICTVVYGQIICQNNKTNHIYFFLSEHFLQIIGLLSSDRSSTAFPSDLIKNLFVSMNLRL